MWDPEQYLVYASERSRPFFDLLSQIPLLQAQQVVDLGCGPGNLTLHLVTRFPGARLRALDADPLMLQRAAELGLATELQDIRDWCPCSNTDVVLSNAVLHWLPEHPKLLVIWLKALKAGAWLGFQVPANQDQPSHQIPLQLAQSAAWHSRLAGVLASETVLDLAAYQRLLAPWADRLNLWQTTYLHSLLGTDPVLDWLSGSYLRPVKAALTDEAWQDFCAELRPLLREAYPLHQGTCLLPFTRRFAVVERCRQS